MWKPVIQLDSALGGAAVGEMHRALSEISQNVEYVLGELPKVQAEAALLDSAHEVFMEFRGTVHDLRTEIFNLADTLGLRPGEDPYDPDLSPDPRVTLGLIARWLGEDLGKVHALVQKLGEAGLLQVLVTESAANILRAGGRVLDEVRRVDVAAAPLIEQWLATGGLFNKGSSD